MLNSLGGSRSTSGCIGMQGICLDWLVGSICLLYICIVLDLAVVVAVCKASMLELTGYWSIQGIYAHIYCIVLDLAVGCSRYARHLCSIDWWGPSAFYIYMHCTRSSSGCSSMQGIYAWLTGGVHLPSIYMHCTRSSSGCHWYAKHLCFNWLCTGPFKTYAKLTGGY